MKSLSLETPSPAHTAACLLWLFRSGHGVNSLIPSPFIKLSLPTTLYCISNCLFVYRSFFLLLYLLLPVCWAVDVSPVTKRFILHKRGWGPNTLLHGENRQNVRPDLHYLDLIAQRLFFFFSKLLISQCAPRSWGYQISKPSPSVTWFMHIILPNIVKKIICEIHSESTSQVFCLKIQLTLGQHKFEQHGSTYMWVFSINILRHFLEVGNNLKKDMNHVAWKYQKI